MRDERSSGIELSRAYFEDLIRPALAARFPGLPYSAGRLGTGSDVLGFDDDVSRDHDWGLRLSLIVPARSVDEVRRELDSDLPATFSGLPVRFTSSGEAGPRLQVDVCALDGLLTKHLGFDPRAGISTGDWLSLSGQAVLQIVAGPVFRDADEQLGQVRALLSWYPDDIWRYVLACDWTRLGQELPLMSRAADVGDATGSRLIAARIAQVLMHLAFLLERRWAPYAKWFGTMFRTLPCAPRLAPSIAQLLDARDRDHLQHATASALELLLDTQNAMGLTRVHPATIPFWDRPYIHPDPAIAAQLLAAVSDPSIRALPLGMGSIEQRTDNVDLLVDPEARRAMTRNC